MSAQCEFVRKSRFDATADQVFDWHARPGALQRLTPPWERVRLLGDMPPIENGSEVRMETRTGPFKTRWVAKHQGVREGESFEDVQVDGPFAAWHHRHLFFPQGNACALEDRIRYTMPFGVLGSLAAPFVRPRIERMFDYRHRVLADDLRRHKAWKGEIPMHVAISGSTGLVGSVLTPFLTTGGHTVSRLVRREAAGTDEIRWDPVGGTVDRSALEGVDAVVHLAGENIASGRWNAARKKAILESRVKGTRAIAEAVAGLERKPAVLVCASAIGFYGDRGETLLDESGSKGSLYLSDVCDQWERSADAAREAGIRVVHLRIGVILSPAGGALAKMLTPFKLGAGGKIGSGKQYMSWIAIDDLVGAIHHAIQDESLEGPVNAVAPNPVTNAEFTKTLGRVLSRPTIAPMPAFAARLAFGEMADELLLASTRVQPKRLEESSFAFGYPELEGALRYVLGRPGK